MGRQANVLRAMRALERIERHLKAQRAAVKVELAAYPAPIPACDAQYNHLAEERRRLSADLARLAEARRRIAAEPEVADQLETLLASSPRFAEAARRTT